MHIRTISAPEVQALIAKGGPVDLIDVRTVREFESVHAVGAKHAPLSDLDPQALLAARTAPAGQPVYLICASGMRSMAAAQAFIDAGFANVYSVSGGTSAWAAAGLPVVRGARPPGLGLPQQIGIWLLVFAGILFLAPCSPMSVWGGAYCPTSPAPPAAAVPAPVAATAVDFTRDVVDASRSKPVLVDFNATWCGPCQKLGPELESLARQQKDRLTLVAIDVDRNRDLAAAHGVEGIPDVRLWKDGRELARFAGYRPQAEVQAWIDQSVGIP